MPMKLLRKQNVTSDALAASVETYASKPPCSSMVMDEKNNIYIGDIEGRAIGVVEASNRTYRVLASDARLQWPDGLCFGQDGQLYFFSRLISATSTPINRPEAIQHSLFRTKPLAEGRPGD
jgi:sugar lactone lactonase YvrE